MTRKSTRAVVLLTNFLPPSSLGLVRELTHRYEEFRIYLSTPMEPNRQWQPKLDGLPVIIQRSLTLKRAWKHPDGFIETHFVHLPYDTLLLLHRHKPDVVISDEFGARTLQSAIYAKLYRKKLLIWAHISESTEKGRSAFRIAVRRVLLRAADAVIVNGRSGASYVQRLHEHARIAVIPRSVDYALFSQTSPRRNPDNRFTLLYVGRLDEGKGILEFLVSLSAWAQSHHTVEVRMQIVGFGPLETKLRQLRPVDNVSVALEPHVPYEHLPSVYANAGALVLPTLADEWGMVVAEALSSGLPVLGSTASQAVTELVEDDVTGWHFNPLDRPSVMNALDRFFDTSPAALEQMGRSAQAVARRIDAASVASRVFDVVGSVCSTRAQGRRP
jgi:glycosyltransferase involved in cell wall biosynthesis